MTKPRNRGKQGTVLSIHDKQIPIQPSHLGFTQISINVIIMHVMSIPRWLYFSYENISQVPKYFLSIYENQCRINIVVGLLRYEFNAEKSYFFFTIKQLLRKLSKVLLLRCLYPLSSKHTFLIDFSTLFSKQYFKYIHDGKY